MPAFVATYTYAADSTDVRSERVAQHLAFMETLQAAGVLQLVGRVDDASVNIMFVLKADSIEDARAALDGDPYAALGVIDTVTVHPWTASRKVLAPI